MRYARPTEAGARVFFTLRLRDPRQIRLTDHVAALRSTVSDVQGARPFRVDAQVVLPDHLHMIWTLPPRDRAWGLRWALIQANMAGVMAPGRRGAVWQRNVEVTVLHSDAAFDWHVDFCVFDPVKHGLVTRPQDWPHTSLHQAVAVARIDRDRPDMIA